MARTGINIYKRKDGRFEGRYIKGYKEDGKINYGYVYGHAFGETKLKLKTAEAAIPQTLSGRFNPTFADIAKSWLNNTSLRVKPSTYANYSASLKNHIIPTIGGFKVRAICAATINRFSKDKLTSGRKDGKGGLASKTVRDMLSIIKSILDYARDEKIKVADFKFTYPKRDKPSARVLSKREQAALEKVLTDEPDKYKTGALLSLYTGLRIGELCALKGKDISFTDNGGIISVGQTLQRVKDTDALAVKKTKILIDTPKSASGVREIPLPSFLTGLISKLAQDNGDGEAFLLSGKGSKAIEPRTMQNHFKKYVEAAGIAPANYHATRHTFATRALESGMDVKSLSEILGHANVNITLNRYVHSSFEQKRAGMGKLERLMSKDVS